MVAIDRSRIFTRAWVIYHEERRAGRQTAFKECLKRSWAREKTSVANNQKIEEAIKEYGITEEVKTWYGWKESGREVIHGQKALFQVKLNKQTNGKEYTASFFGYSQTTDEPQEEKAA